MAEDHYDECETLFSLERFLGDKSLLSTLKPSMVMCNSCYMRWFNDVCVRGKKPSTSTTKETEKKGHIAYLDAADKEREVASELYGLVKRGATHHKLIIAGGRVS